MLAELQIKSDQRFERAWYRFELVAFWFMGAVLVAVMSGLLGSGWLGKATVPVPGSSLRIEYERIKRNGLPAQFRLVTDRARSREGLVLSFDKSFLDSRQITGIQPQPTSARAEMGGTSFTFAAGPDGGLIALSLEPSAERLVHSQVLIDGHPVAFTQIILP